MVTQDSQACSTTVPESIVTFVEVRGGHLHWLQARDAQSRETRPLRLIQSPRASWEFSPPLGKTLLAHHREILEVNAQVGPTGASRASSDPAVSYRRYHFDGQQWLKSESLHKETWDGTGRFPDRNKFP